jgi:hypothetical protein
VNRKILLAVAFCTVAGLSVAASATFGQEQQQEKPKLQVRHAIKPAKTADAEQVKSAVASGAASKTPMLPLFTFNVGSDRDDNAALKDVLAGLKVDRIRAQKIVTLLLRDKVLIKVSDDLVFHQDALAELRRQMAAEKTKSPRIDVARFKDLTGVSRKYAIPLLEYLDREHVTRRVGDARTIL